MTQSDSLFNFKRTKRYKLYAYLVLCIFSLSILNSSSYANISITPVTNDFSSRINIPAEIGYIRETYTSQDKNAPEVIYIQDAHAHYEAQKNIGAIQKR